MSPGITAAVVEPEDETRAWLRSSAGEVLVWVADTPDYVMQYAVRASLGDRVRWPLRTIALEGKATYQSYATFLADPEFTPALSRLVGQVELTEQSDPTARDVGRLVRLDRIDRRRLLRGDRLT